ncbi:zinc-dependent alcohol dehydrogenase [Streptomyces iranensis]|nr:alcohol dehydrogenase catalytic domain-containing protein [Streptomyces iranensis]MBP2063521.1 2-desacetyl-2-hydroxyethyl bacteriochlorophyllide A dehydrogenase [Streptomyces iranensis]
MDRRVTVTADGEVTLDRVPRPRPAAGEVRVSTRLIGICGTDVHARRGEHPFISRPYHPGHEAVGVVAETGPGVTSLAEGDRVLLEPNLVCGTCRHCRSGRYNICATLRVIGCQTAGAMADSFTVPAGRLHRVPDGLTDAQAVLVEPLATPVHAVRRAGDLAGSDVLVIGAGPIGLLTALATRAAGARTVIVTDPVAAKRDRALRLGADAAYAPDTPGLPDVVRERLGGGADAVFDCVSVSASVTQAVQIVEKGGTVMVVGVPQGPSSVPLDLVQDREITVRGSLMYVEEDVRAAVSLLAAGAVPVEEFITATFPLDRADEAFRAAGSPDQMKVLVAVG